MTIIHTSIIVKIIINLCQLIVYWRVKFCEERSKYETYPWQSRKINHGTTHTILFPERICTTKI